MTAPAQQTSDAGAVRRFLRRRLGFLAMAAGLLVLPATHALYPFFLMEALCFALFACAFNLLIGYGGLLSFGHAMFWGTGGYVTAYAAAALGLSPELALALGALGAGVLGVLVATIAIRRQGVYFAMITLALSQLVYFVFLQAPFTHGEDGIQGVPQGRLFGLFALSDPLTLSYVVVVIFLLTFAFLLRVIHSPFGDVLAAVRENETRALSLGYNVERYKFLAFVLSAALSGLAGGLKAIVAQNASLTDAHWTMSGQVVLMTLIGGIGAMYGPIVGAFIVVAMQQYLAQFGQWATVIQGAIFIVCVLAFRGGVAGELKRLSLGRYGARALGKDRPSA